MLFREYHGIVSEIEAEETAKSKAKQIEKDRARAARTSGGPGSHDEDESFKRLQQLRLEQVCYASNPASKRWYMYCQFSNSAVLLSLLGFLEHCWT